MSSSDAVDQTAAQINGATSFVMIFGALPSGSAAERKKTLRERFNYLAKLVHPDKVSECIQNKAGEVFKMLQDARHAAEAALDAGTYEAAFSSRSGYTRNGQAPAALVELHSASRIYRLDSSPFEQGDFSVIYRAREFTSAVGSEVLVKIASEPMCNIWLEREAQLLERFHSPSETKLVRLSTYVPKLLDTFFISDGGGKRFRANVMAYQPNVVSVRQIIEAYPVGFDPSEGAWVCRRILAQVIAANMAGVVHGAIVPDHVLVDRLTRVPIHIGWAHAVTNPKKTDAKITHVINRWRDCYPPEILAKEVPDRRSDIFMAGKTIIQLLGGNVKTNVLPPSLPREFVSAILKCVASKPADRYQSGRQALDEVTRVIRSLWGSSYRPLVLPVRS